MITVLSRAVVLKCRLLEYIFFKEIIPQIQNTEAYWILCPKFPPVGGPDEGTIKHNLKHISEENTYTLDCLFTLIFVFRIWKYFFSLSKLAYKKMQSQLGINKDCKKKNSIKRQRFHFYAIIHDL